MKNRYTKKKQATDLIKGIETRLANLKVLLKIEPVKIPTAIFHVSKAGNLFTYNNSGKRVGGVRVVASGDTIEYNPSECFFRLK